MEVFKIKNVKGSVLIKHIEKMFAQVYYKFNAEGVSYKESNSCGSCVEFEP